MIVNNIAETFNAYIIRARSKHIIYMLEDIMCALLSRLYEKRQMFEGSGDDICPRIRKKLEKEKEHAKDCHVLPSTYCTFQVKHELEDLTVNLEVGTCTCRKWDLSGIPCSHAIACAFFLKAKVEIYVSEWYKLDKYMKAYEGSINPCSG